MKNTNKEKERPNQISITLHSPKQLEVIKQKAGENECTKGVSAFMRAWIKGDTDLMQAGITSEIFNSRIKKVISACLGDE